MTFIQDFTREESQHIVSTGERHIVCDGNYLSSGRLPADADTAPTLDAFFINPDPTSYIAAIGCSTHYHPGEKFTGEMLDRGVVFYPRNEVAKEWLLQQHVIIDAKAGLGSQATPGRKFLSSKAGLESGRVQGYYGDLEWAQREGLLDGRLVFAYNNFKRVCTGSKVNVVALPIERQREHYRGFASELESDAQAAAPRTTSRGGRY